MNLNHPIHCYACGWGMDSNRCEKCSAVYSPPLVLPGEGTVESRLVCPSCERHPETSIHLHFVQDLIAYRCHECKRYGEIGADGRVPVLKHTVSSFAAHVFVDKK